MLRCLTFFAVHSFVLSVEKESAYLVIMLLHPCVSGKWGGVGGGGVPVCMPRTYMCECVRACVRVYVVCVCVCARARGACVCVCVCVSVCVRASGQAGWGSMYVSVDSDLLRLQSLFFVHLGDGLNLNPIKLLRNIGSGSNTISHLSPPKSHILS